MTKYRISLIIVSTLLIFAFIFGSTLAGKTHTVSADALVEPDAGPATNPLNPKDQEEVFTKYPRYFFTKAVSHTDTMKYRVKVWNFNSDLLVYEIKGLPTCTVSICWLDPVLPLKYLDLAGLNGLYYWTAEAKVGTYWSLPSDKAYFKVMSPGFNSSFDTLNKWVVLRGPWTTVSPGFLTTETKPDKFLTVAQKHQFTTGYKYEVRMKRTGEIGKGNYIIISGYPYDSSGLVSPNGWDDGYLIGYNNIGYWFIYKRVNGVETKLAPDPNAITPAVRPYKWNIVTVYVKDKMIYLWINGQYIGKVYDEFFPPNGWVGIGVDDSTTVTSPILVDWATLEYMDTLPYPME